MQFVVGLEVLDRKMNNEIVMEMNVKRTYEAPAITVVEVETEGIVCTSQTDYNYGGMDEED